MASGGSTGCKAARGVLALRWAVVATLALLSASCGFTGLPVSGRVWDAKTGRPLPDAIVVVRWNGVASSIADSRGVCIHVETATSDAEGRYRTPWWWQKPNFYSNGLPFADAYLPGYESVHAHTPEAEAHQHDVYMQKFVGTDAERLEYIRGRVFGGMNCHSGTPSEHHLVDVFIPAYGEAKRSAQAAQWAQLETGLRESVADAWFAEPHEAPSRGSQFENLPNKIKTKLQ